MEDFLLNLLNGVGKINFKLVEIIFLLIFIIFWIVVLDWVWMDSGERTTNRRARIIYVLLVLFLNVIGWIIYLIIRPSQTIEQIYWADLERRYLKYETAELDDCVKCGTQLYPGYTFCPKCGLEIKMKCKACGTYIEKDSDFCAFCGKKVTAEEVVEEAPSKEVMEQQIQASKEEAAMVVESEKTRYSTKKRSLAVKIGAALIHSYESLLSNTKKNNTTVQKTENTVKKAKNTKKRKKNKKR